MRSTARAAGAGAAVAPERGDLRRMCYGTLEVISSNALVQRDTAETQHFSTAVGVRGRGSCAKAGSVWELGWHLSGRRLAPGKSSTCSKKTVQIGELLFYFQQRACQQEGCSFYLNKSQRAA